MNTVIEHRNKLSVPSIATSEIKQQVAEITRGLESDLKRVEAASLEKVESLQTQVESLKKELNQASVEGKTMYANSVSEVVALNGKLVALKQEVDIIERVPKPFRTAESPPPDLLFDTVEVHGVKFEFAVRKKADVDALHSHIQREITGYAILKDAIEQSKQQPPLVMDVGANHGLYSLFAAKLGADVIVVEPQEVLCRLILVAAKKNGVEDRITVYNSAVLEKHEMITMKDTEVSDGEIATVVRGGDTGENDVKVKAFPIYQFLSRGDSRRIAFLKIGVEGFDLHAIQSAASLFAQKRVENALVEFGPAVRWKEVAGDDPQMGLTTLKDLHAEYGMEPRIVQGWEHNVWPHFITELGMTSEARASKAEQAKFFRLATDKYKTILMDSMEAVHEESLLWLVPEEGKAEYPVFESDCSNIREGDKVAAPEGGTLTSFGCPSDINGTDTDTAD